MLEDYKLNVIPSKYEGIKVGEKIQFFAYLTDRSHQVATGKVRYIISTNVREVLTEGELDLADITPAVEYTPEEPCSIQCEFVYNLNGEELKVKCGVMVEADKIEPAVVMPDDYDQFWNSWKDKLAEIPLNAKLEKISNNHIDLYDVTLDCIGGKPVKAVLGLPKDRAGKKYPVSVAFQGAGVRSARVEDVIPMVNRGFIALEVNAHGLDNYQSIEDYEEIGAGLEGYSTGGFDSEDPNDIYFLNMFLRAKRAIDFAATIDEWDGENLNVIGGSMGGFQTFAASYLDERVTALSVGVPAGCNIIGGGWPLCDEYRKLEDQKKQRLAKTLPYFDNVNFARKLTVPAFFSVGLIDEVCTPESVYAVYNSYAGDKRIVEETEEGHALPLRSRRSMWDFLKNQSQ